MIVLDNGDAIRAIASVDAVVDYTIHGYVGITATQLADGQVTDGEADLYASGADGTVVLGITMVNTHAAAVTVNLYLKPSSGTSRRILSKDMSLNIGYSLHTDGTTVVLVNTQGHVVYSYPAHHTDHEDGGDDEISIAGLDGEPADTVNKSLFNANTILAATLDNTPVALTIAASRILGRKAAGGIVAMTGAELMAILSGKAGADFSMNTHKITGVVDPTANQHAATKKYVDDKAPAALPRGRAFLTAELSNFPTGKDATVDLDDVTFDADSMFQNGVWQAGVGDGGSNATTIIDADPTTGAGFEASMRLSRVTWDAGASYGFITSVDSATQVTIYKTTGTNFAPGDTYTIAKAYFLIPTAGYWLAFGMVTWDWQDIVTDKIYNGLIIKNGTAILQTGFPAIPANTVSCPLADIFHFAADDKVALAAKNYSGADVGDIIGSAGGIHTYLVISLLEAD